MQNFKRFAEYLVVGKDDFTRFGFKIRNDILYCKSLGLYPKALRSICNIFQEVCILLRFRGDWLAFGSFFPSICCWSWYFHYSDVIVGAMVSQITNLTIAYLTVYSGANQSKHQSSASLAFVRGIHWWPVNSPPKWPVTRKMLPFVDVIIIIEFSTTFICTIGSMRILFHMSTRHEAWFMCKVRQNSAIQWEPKVNKSCSLMLHTL